MRGYRTGPKNPHRENIKRLNAVMPTNPPKLMAVRDRGGEWVVRNEKGHVLASGFDDEQEAKAWIGVQP